MEKYVITITRQFGSLGRPIAQKMSELLGIEFYDRDIVDDTAKKLKLPTSIIEEKEETAVQKVVNKFSRMAFPLGSSSDTTQDKIFEAQSNIINFLVDRESCIVVGRCSDFVLSDRENSMHIFIYAPYAERVKNSIEELGLDEAEAKRMVKEVDIARDSYHMHFAGFLPDDKRFKDIMIDSSFLGIDATAEYLAEMVRKKFEM
ncbi:MAG: cytidylate kinase-like family protein [Lachnospiraceae bacterium]